MLRENKENAASWGISFGVHLVILMLVAATGLFQAVSTESHPVDVEIYDNVTEDEQPSDDSAEAEAQAAAPEPEAAAPDPIVIDERIKVPEVEKEMKAEKQEEQDKDKPAKNPSADAKANASDAKGTNGAPGGKEGGSDKPQGGPAHVKHVKVRAQQLSTSQPAYPVALQGRNAVGSVTVNYIINASGGVESPQIEASSGYPEMDAAALAAIVNFIYSPARNDYDEPVNTHGRYTFRFHP